MEGPGRRPPPRPPRSRARARPPGREAGPPPPGQPGGGRGEEWLCVVGCPEKLRLAAGAPGTLPPRPKAPPRTRMKARATSRLHTLGRYSNTSHPERHLMAGITYADAARRGGGARLAPEVLGGQLRGLQHELELLQGDLQGLAAAAALISPP